MGASDEKKPPSSRNEDWRVAETVPQRPGDSREDRRLAETVPRDRADPSVDETIPSSSVGGVDPSVDETIPSSSVGGVDPSVDETVPSGSAEEAATGPGESGLTSFRTGDRFGAFEVLERIGAGGMGVVLAARDPDLDRKVAIKVLHADAGGPGARERLLREARAMAQLTHENVITVHQVGTRADQVFVVMEYVDGGTLRDWRQAAPRSWCEVVHVYRHAGRGLAAAHHAGLIHRDFKPDNVLVRSDGRVLVTDFGLVGVDDPEGTSEAARKLTVSSSSLRGGARVAADTPAPSSEPVVLTRTGEVLGTPLYMAPEQHQGARADARADQYAFCVALYEALYGQRPFAGETYRELMAAVLRGRPEPPPPRSEVPAWVHAVLLRGMSLEREARYPDMDALLAALDDDPLARRRRRLRWVAAGAGVAALAAVLAVVLRTDPGARCTGAAGERLARVWGERQRRAVRAAHGPHVVAALDRYGAAWARESAAACDATFSKGGQSELLLERRMRCLDRRLGRMGALVGRLESGKKPKGGAVADAAAALPTFAECRDRDALAALPPPPEGAHGAIRAVTALIHQAEAHRTLGEFEQGLAAARKALARAKPTGYAPIIGRAHYVVGFLAGLTGDRPGAERHLRQAIRLAAAARAHHLEAISWLSLIYQTGHGAGRPDQALAMAPAAEAAVARAAADPSLRARLEGNLGLILMTKGDYKGALTRLERSLSVYEKALGPDDLDTAVAANNLAMLLERLGRYDEAYAHLERVLKVRRRALGPDHPSVATALNDLGNTAHSLGKLKLARRHLESALAIRERALGEGHIRTSHTLNNLAIVLGDMNRFEEAARQARRAVAVAERAAGKDSVELAGPLNTLGNQLRYLGRQKEAWEAYARGLAIVEHVRGKDHISAAPMLENLARIMVKLGLYDRALQFVDRALAMRSRVQGEAHPMTVEALALRGSFNLDAKRPEAAAADFARQLSVVTRAHGAEHVEVALAGYNLAAALERGGKLDEAAARYRAALAIFDKVAPRHRFVANGWRGLGDVAVAKRDLRAAAAHFEKAVAAAAAVGNPGLADMLHELGRVQGKLGQWADAVKTFERAVKARQAGDPALLALARFELARALWSGGTDRARALALARDARRLFVAAGERAENNVKEVDAWLRRR